MAKIVTKSTRQPQRIFNVVMWGLSIVFAGFLIGFGGLVIRDIPSVERDFRIEDFVDQKELEALEDRERTLEAEASDLRRQEEDATTQRAALESEYRIQSDAFENWLATRSVTDSAETNPEVIDRNQELEALSETINDTERGIEMISAKLLTNRRSLNDVRTSMSSMREDAKPDYQRARNLQELRIFGFRLILTLPLLVASGWIVVRRRESSYWPLYRGFVLFSAVAFFVELVPYLPTYGGYVRYAVGIIVVVISGFFLIQQMRLYMDRKRDEELRSEEERRKNIDYETALKKIAAKSCPGCDRDIVSRDGVHSDFCVHCGIHLQRVCDNCGTRNITFHRFCLSCGVSNVPELELIEDTSESPMQLGNDS